MNHLVQDQLSWQRSKTQRGLICPARLRYADEVEDLQAALRVAVAQVGLTKKGRETSVSLDAPAGEVEWRRGGEYQASYSTTGHRNDVAYLGCGRPPARSRSHSRSLFLVLSLSLSLARSLARSLALSHSASVRCLSA